MQYKLRDFVPLIVIFSLILLFTILRQFYMGFHMISAMRDFMGSFFIVFGAFKVFNLRGFATAYQTYDLLAKRVALYAYLYPFLELALGVSYFVGWNPFVTNLATVVLMSFSALGVFNELRKGNEFMCACLGVVFKIPMTYVTLLEDLLMAVMALIMLLI
jgi:hypothetical protein